jgi:hypothetical protein
MNAQDAPMARNSATATGLSFVLCPTAAYTAIPAQQAAPVSQDTACRVHFTAARPFPRRRS